ncbi:hypothetical protein L6452_21043 [Arctium lappa]|uniref:Uncharacterized protein n=1 Tax=Arctium lappa TaxID=4217 RepID=A0ACB9BDH7_ARCLA|nr:hypothetical protein L6452_21043 [Arctium lappa]
MLHNNTNKFTLILIYAFLEWILIALLLLNSVFSYFIIKFAQFFGLNSPCFLCARFDRFFEPENNNSCLGFCSIHRTLAESRDSPRSFVFSKVERIDVIGEDEVRSKYGVDFEAKFGDDCSCFVIHPLWDVLGDDQKGNRIDDHEAKIDTDERIESECVEENREIGSEKGDDGDEEFETEESEIEVIRDSNCLEHDLIRFEKEEDSISAIRDVQFFIDYSGNQLFPFELLDSKTEENPKNSEDEDHEFGDFQKAQVKSEEIDDSFHRKTEELTKYGEKYVVYHENLIDFTDEQVAVDEETRTPSVDNEELRENDSDLHSVDEEESVSIGTEIPVLDSCNEIKHEEHSTISDNLHSNIENAHLKLENFDEIEEERAPETPSSIHSLNPLHKKWLMPETKESGAEESFDGSAISEADGGDPVNTAEKLKSALKAERKTLHHLYSELEEERNASAVAANETMAMINRLQEEKAAMQMEALQYQRMMEEQSEYDHEALQLLNELMIKKETELESYRKKVSDYESREKMRFSRTSKDGSTKTGTSSVSWSHSEDDDGLSVDLNRESQHQNTPIESILDLESFEEERVSILEQLKVLEEKLFALSDEEDRHFANVTVIEDHYEEVTTHGVKGPVVEFVQNGKQPMGKRLLQLFDAISTTSEDGVTTRNGYEIGFRPIKFEDTAVTRFELEKKRIDMEEEVDQLYGRLQALEADKEFLKHCIGSMKKGEKGMELLQEILQHLRNLRTKTYTDNTFI